MSEQPDIDRLADTVREFLANCVSGMTEPDVAEVEAVVEQLVALAREQKRLTQNIIDCNARSRALAEKLGAAEARVAELNATVRTMIGARDELARDRNAAEARVAELKAALRDTLTEIDELGTAYTALRKKHEPPYIVYIPWSRPAALAALAGDGGGNNVPSQEDIYAINDALQLLEKWMDIERIYDGDKREVLRRAYQALATIEGRGAALAGDGGGAPKDLSHLDSFYLGGPVTPMSRAEHDEYRRWREDYARRTAGDGGGA